MCNIKNNADWHGCPLKLILVLSGCLNNILLTSAEEATISLELKAQQNKNFLISISEKNGFQFEIDSDNDPKPSFYDLPMPPWKEVQAIAELESYILSSGFKKMSGKFILIELPAPNESNREDNENSNILAFKK